MPRPDPGPLRILYRFRLHDGTVKEFDILLDRRTLALKPNGRRDLPAWTQLSYNKCTNCPLNEKESPVCPIAASLVEPLEFFKKAISHHEVDVEIVTTERTYTKRTPIQFALGAMIGIYMVTSGCPIMDKLRPMVRLHTPFASSEETTFRAIATYLLAQYMIYKRGGEPDWDLKGLTKNYEEISTLNECFKRRVVATQIEDANLNALVHLDLFARMANLMLLNEKLEKLEGYFSPYLKDDAA